MPKGIYIRTKEHRERMVKKDEEFYKINSQSGCWDFTGATFDTGYGQLRRNRKIIRAHRYFYEKYKGAVPQGYDLDHLCKNKKCVNPQHLEAVTHYENCLRGSATKLTKEIVGKIRSLYKGGSRTTALARKFNINRVQVWRIINKINWKYT